MVIKKKITPNAKTQDNFSRTAKVFTPYELSIAQKNGLVNANMRLILA